MDECQVKIIINALNAGWSVSKTKDNVLEFTKNKHKMTAEEQKLAMKDGFSAKFLNEIIKA